MCGKNTIAKKIWDCLALAHEDTIHVCENKAIILVRKYELFKMEGNEDIEIMFVRFQTLVQGYKVFDKSTLY